MNDIYNILPKYLSGEATADEKRQVATFKEEHSLEYTMLRRLWEGNSIEVHAFDSNQAAEKIKATLREQKREVGKVRSFYQRIARIAAVFVLLLVVGGVVWYTIHQASTPTLLSQVNTGLLAREVQLPDGSTVWLNKGATVFFPEEFGGAQRTVRLEGEAFFEVERNPQKPFLIEAGKTTVKVLGTSFNVLSQQDFTQVNVRTGKVQLATQSGAEKVILVAGESAEARQGNLVKYATTTPNYLSWKSGKFLFEKVRLDEVLKELNKFYSISYVVEDQQKAGQVLTFRIDQADIEEVHEIIQLTCDVEIEDKGEYYVIR